MGHSPVSHPSDADLVLAIRRDRSDAAFSILYDRHTPRALQTAWRILGGNAHEAEDAMQDAWIRAVATLEPWRNDGAFGAWLPVITAHVAIDLLRRERRLTFETDVELPAAEQQEQIDLER